MSTAHHKSRRICALPLVAARVLVLILLGIPTILDAQGSGDGRVDAPQIAPGVYVLSNPSGNLMVRVGPTKSFVAGAQLPDLVARARVLLRDLNAPPVQFVVAAVGDSLAGFEDGGWEETGAIVAAQENFRYRMYNLRQEAKVKGGKPMNALPSLGFSEVVQLSLYDDEAHAVHQAAGYSNADVIVHLERENVIYLGYSLATDGYPSIDLANGGSVQGLIKTIDVFAQGLKPDTKDRYVGGRGPTVGGDGLLEYRNMLVTSRDRIQAFLSAGKSLQATIAAKPLSAFDSRWGQGRISTDQFVSLVYQSLSKH